MFDDQLKHHMQLNMVDKAKLIVSSEGHFSINKKPRTQRIQHEDQTIKEIKGLLKACNYLFQIL